MRGGGAGAGGGGGGGGGEPKPGKVLKFLKWIDMIHILNISPQPRQAH